MLKFSQLAPSRLLGSLQSTHGRISLLKPLQTAQICRKEDMDPEIVACKPKAWPWETVPFFNVLGMFGIDRNVNRFDENTVVISVEGNIGVGKTTFAKALSEALGTRFYPEPDLDLLYKRKDGFDYRSINYKLPENCHYMDTKLFYLNPDHPAVSGFENLMFLYRAWQWLDVVSHVLSTGQGCVTDRSPWSSLAFQTAAHKMKFGACGKSFMEFVKHVRDEVQTTLLRPHVVIYLDAPAEVCLERVKKRGIPYEVNSKAMCKQYLDHIEFTYKDYILPELDAHAEVLVYDWQNPPDLDLVIDDLSKLNVHERPEGEKMEDWKFNTEVFYDLLRRHFTTNRDYILSRFNHDAFWAPDLLVSIEEMDHREDVLKVCVPPFHEYYSANTPFEHFKQIITPQYFKAPYLDRYDFNIAEPRPKRPSSK